jgi:hypothetical protein
MIFKIYYPKNTVITKYKVYFDPETGKIYGVTNREDPEHTDYFELPVQDLEDFLIGKRNIVHHKVVFDIKEQAYKIINKQESLIVYVDDLIFKVATVPSYQILIEQDVVNKQWKISASDELKEKMKSITSRLEETMFFSITEKNNPNILFNHFYVSIGDIIKQDFVKVAFVSQDEETFGITSVYTNRKFDRYSHKAINE